MSPYDPFNHRPQRPSRLNLANHFLLRMLKLRSGWATCVALVAGLCLLACIWRVMAIVALPAAETFKGVLKVPTGRLLRTGPGSKDVVSTDDPASSLANTVAATSDSLPSFHLLIPASQINADFCKTLISVLILDYPPPIIVNFNKTFGSSSWDNGTHIGKIRGVLEHMRNSPHIEPDDLVLVIDGYDDWFQLPPNVLLERYHSLVHRVNDDLKASYGQEAVDRAGTGQQIRQARYTASVIFGADKLCWPNNAADPACYSIPTSSLPKTAWGPATDVEPNGYHNRPRYLNSGNIMGRASAMQALYRRAYHKADTLARGSLGDQFVFAEIFGEQEYQRSGGHTPSTRTKSDRWRQWLTTKLGDSASSSSSHRPLALTPNNMTAVPGERYEYAIALDYEMALFQTMTHAHDDVEFVVYNESDGGGAALSAAARAHRVPPSTPMPTFPAELLQALDGSLSNASRTDQEAAPLWFPWRALPLATNLHVPSVPPVLHFNGDKSYLATWWPRMWFQPSARALLRQAISAPAPAAGSTTRPWRADAPGGRGGAWTDGGLWLPWADLCGGLEEEVFGDGLGRWGRETGAEDGRVYDSWGKLVEDPDVGV